MNFNFTELSGFNGLTTAAGYTFDSQLTADTDIYLISFSAQTVPEPATMALAGIGLIGMVGYRRLRRREPGSKIV